MGTLTPAGRLIRGGTVFRVCQRPRASLGPGLFGSGPTMPQGTRRREPVSGRSPLFTQRNVNPFRLQPPSTLPVMESGGSQTGQTPSGLRQSLAGSPGQPAESSLRKLRTGVSAGVALHLPSRGRSYLRLPAIQTRPDRDFHPAVLLRSKAHECGDASPLWLVWILPDGAAAEQKQPKAGVPLCL